MWIEGGAAHHVYRCAIGILLIRVFTWRERWLIVAVMISKCPYPWWLLDRSCCQACTVSPVTGLISIFDYGTNLSSNNTMKATEISEFMWLHGHCSCKSKTLLPCGIQSWFYLKCIVFNRKVEMLSVPGWPDRLIKTRNRSKSPQSFP